MADMATITEVEIDKTLLSHMQQAIDASIKALHGAEPLVPFVMTWRDTGERTIERFMYGTYEDSIEMAMRSIQNAEADIEAYIVAWDGYIAAEGSQRQEAIVMEGALRAMPEAMQLAQPYTIDETGTAAVKDALAFLGQTHNLLTTPEPHPTMTNHLIRPAYMTPDNVKDQPFVQMPIAVICLAANLFEGEEAERITIGIRQLQTLEQTAASEMSQHVFSTITPLIAEGDLMAVLPTDSTKELMALLINGANQLHNATQKGLVLAKHVQSYLGEVRGIMQAVLTQNGAQAVSEGGEKLLQLLDKVSNAPA